MSLQTKNNQKTLSLSNICAKHKKEIIMIDIDSENKKVEQRFACVQCISDNPQCQYKTIEDINQKWNEKLKKEDHIFNDLKSNRLKKKEKLNQKIAEMRKNYILQLDDINETLRTGFSFTTTQAREIKKFNQDSIQQLSKEELNQQIQSLIQNNQEKLIQDSKIELIIKRDSRISKEIENKLEQLKQHDQLDIQESINILYDKTNDNQIQGIFQHIQQIQESTMVNQEQLIRKQELDEFISSSTQIYCQIDLFNQTIKKFQDHQIKINSINDKIKLFQDNQYFKNLLIQLHDYKDKFEKDFKNFKKFCEIDKLEKNIETLKKDYKKLESENLKLESQHLKEEQRLLNERLKKEQNNNDQLLQQLREQQINYQNQIVLLNQQIQDKDNLITEIQSRLDKLGLNIKPDLLKDQYWITLIKILQQKVNKQIKNSILIYTGTKDGLNNQQYWSKVNGKGNLLMVFKSKSDHILGAYSPCIWESCCGKYVADNTLSSFIFSQTNDQVFPLMKDTKKYAIFCHSNYGPIFGNGYDMKIGGDFKDGYSKLGNSYQYSCQNYGEFEPNLFGQKKPEIKECQIYELQFF
ncbi:unnamed protein product [Paramecium pentaurelia]|uniref:TLDc domain-containing protein n=1 Tax=Paramecium pentaurelia TaxID=43138 RepID=A0A8S1XH51_9CILI|nr:unnamed protein product [Paramecium pentaurelia]